MTRTQSGATGKALLVSGSLGMGHDIVAEACSGTLQAHGWATETLNAMQLLGRRGRAAGEAVFRGMLSVPGLFDAYHFGALRAGNRLALLTDAAATGKLVPRLRDHLVASRPDLVISVFATGASAVSRLAGQFPALSHVVLCTDATPHRLWVQPHVDLYLVTSALAEAAVRRFQPEARVVVIPPAVRAAFYRPPAQSLARARLGVPPAERCVLLMSGGWGLGPVAAAAEALAAAGVHVLAVAGRNAKLEARLTEAARRQPRLRAFGYCDAIVDLMASADLVVTSSGDTCAEARTVGRSLLLLDMVQGHGRDNLQHQLELGDASVTSARPADVVRCALAALDRVKPPAAGATRSLADWDAAFTSALATIGLLRLAAR